MGYRFPEVDLAAEAALRRWASAGRREDLDCPPLPPTAFRQNRVHGGSLDVAISLALPEAKEDREVELMRREDESRYDLEGR